MKICLIHDTLNRSGGGERIAVSLIEGLKSEGNRVTLVTADRLNPLCVMKNFNKKVTVDQNIYMSKISLAIGSPLMLLYHAIFLRFLILRKLRRERFDLVIDTFSSGFIDFSRYFKCPIICYMHLPPFSEYEVYTLPKIMYYSSLKLAQLLDKLFSVKARTYRVCNSKFTRSIRRSIARENPLVVYPPVDVKEFRLNADKIDRDIHIISVGAFTLGRKHAGQIEIVKKISKKNPNVKLLILGDANVANSQYILKSIYRKVSEYKLDNNVMIKTNVPLPELREYLWRSKVFLQTRPYESFGISVVEAMAAGCVPLVREDGAPYIDIIDKEEYGFAYSSLEQASQVALLLLSDYKLWSRFHLKACKRALCFDEKVFEKSMLQLIHQAARAKIAQVS